ncbi:MAG: YbfB/YjiJ family MFS transporter [Campylobacteraceae bacterium]|nr:YbfB/YjiJ family MFS transporter [Campylobacteraceae bacterium]
MIKPLLLYKKSILIVLLGVFACLGLARFSFGMILPNMQIHLQMSATQAGIVGSANFIGYFLGLFVVGRWYLRFGVKTIIIRALSTQGLAMIAMAFSSHFIFAAMFFAIAGFFGALANIALMTHIAQIVPISIRGRATGIVVAGIGLAVIVSGVLVPLIDQFTELSWRASWIFFAFLVMLIAFLSHRYLAPNLGTDELKKEDTKTLPLQTIIRTCSFWQTGVLFFLFGLCAIMFMTFFVAAVEESWQFGSEISGIFWTILGVSSIFSGPIFGAISDRFGRHTTLGLLFTLQGVAHLLLVLSTHMAGTILSAFLFGLSAWAVPSIMATLSSELFGPFHTARILSFITLFFGIGQIIGPLIAGVLRDLTGNFTLGFSLSAFLLWSGVFVALKGCSYNKFL